MWEDPIVAEVHQTREKPAAQYNFDIGAFFSDVRKRQAAIGARLTLRRNQSEPAADADGDRPSGSGEFASAKARSK